MLSYRVGYRVNTGRSFKSGASDDLPSGIYMVTEEEYFMCEEDNEDILFIEEDEE